MKYVDVTTQAELDAALKAGDYPQLRGNCEYVVSGSSQVTACDSSQVTAYGSSQVTACDSSQVTACDSSQVTACGSSQVRAYGSSQVRAYGSSQVTACGSSQVTACGSSQVTACGSSQVTASKFVAVTSHGAKVTISGGFHIQIPRLEIPSDWCEFYGVTVDDGHALLYKAVDDEYRANRPQADGKGFAYTPGTMPVAPDWDGGKAECGGGLHFSPRPFMALQFHHAATKFVGCWVALTDMAVHPGGDYPQKCKARGVSRPVFEVDIDGKAVGA